MHAVSVEHHCNLRVLSTKPSSHYISVCCTRTQPLAYPKISEAKARACISTNMSSRAYGSKYLSADGTPDEFVRLVNQISTMGGQIAAFPGGVLVRSKDDGQVIGAVGVSGAAGAEDEYIALKAIHLSSAREDIMTEPEQHSCTTAKLLLSKF
jgi:uncharacterized protein GlcG (DUF336 family)